MARPKKVETNTASIVEGKNSTVETKKEIKKVVTEEKETIKEKPVIEEVQEEKKEPEKPVTEKKAETLGKTVVVKCESLAGRKLSLPTRIVDFDENGKCEVTREEAQRLLTIPGYELAK